MQTSQASYPLTPLQRAMLLHHLASSGGQTDGTYLEQIVGNLQEAVEPTSLRAAWEKVIARHDSLRTSFAWEGLDEPQQRVNETLSSPWEELDWSSVPLDERNVRFEAFLLADRRRGLAPDVAPLLRLTLIRFADSDWRLVWSFHHLIIDGRSFPIILKEVFDLYDAAREGRELALQEPARFRAHVEWLRTKDFSTSEPYWRERLRGFTTPTPLPGLRDAQHGKARSGALTDQDVAVAEYEVQVSEATTAALKKLAEARGLTLNTFAQACWALTLHHFSGEADIVFGAARACRRSSAAAGVAGAETMTGMFLNTVPVRVSVRDNAKIMDWLAAHRADQRTVWTHEHTPLTEILGWSDVPAGTPLFQSIVVFDEVDLTDQLRQGERWNHRSFRLHERTAFPLTLYGNARNQFSFRLAVHAERFTEDPGQRLVDHFVTLLDAIARHPEATLVELPTLAPQEAKLVLEEWNRTELDYDRDACLHQLFERQVLATPQAVAVVCGDQAISYADLNARANQLAHRLRALGVGPDRLVGVCLERSIDMMVALFGVLKAGGSYVPLDPAFPAERIAYMVEDAKLHLILTQQALLETLPAGGPRRFTIDGDWSEAAEQPTTNVESGVAPHHLAYVIYTSGSTGKPKGVLVEHRNAVNFLAGMSERVPHGESGGQDAWLAVTSLSFDISVLELFWSLARGFKVVLYGGPQKAAARASGVRARPGALQFSLFYFASDEGEASADKYRLLIEGAKFADRNGFVAVSTPERHFHAFGGLYPNPAVSGAAIAAITENVQIRAGSVVLPLHHPIRIAEEWALVDNLSNGRVGISFASGWQPVDFVLRPENHAERQKVLYEGMDTVRRLWRGETLEFLGVDGKMQAIRTLPRPIQPELPVWVTTAGSPETWKTAGRIGANVLTHMLGQSLEDISARIQEYRQARREAGHEGPGHVTMMLHTFVGDDVDEVREIVRKPMTEYLRTSMSLIKNVASSWTAYKRRADGSAATGGLDLNSLSPEDMEDLLAFSFERYFETSGLFGTPESCMAMIERLEGVGVSEVACLIDFGVASETVLKHLDHLNRLRKLATGVPAGAEETSTPESMGALIRRHGITHLQCTPSMASMLVADPDTAEELGRLRCIMIGGEAFPGHLAARLRATTNAKILNMYGPTETTVWSTTHEVDEITDTIRIGRPIANTTLYVLDAAQRPVPRGAVGELYIGGDGVTRGYHERPELTAERFVPDRFGQGEPRGRLYRTGDLVRYRADGELEFLGRTDFQVKIRGYRIELGEIEAVIAGHPNVQDVAVLAREDEPGDVRLVAYVTSRDGRTVPSDELRGLARSKLPDYMVPAHCLTLDAFPQTPNRKIDRRALPSPKQLLEAGAGEGNQSTQRSPTTKEPAVPSAVTASPRASAVLSPQEARQVITGIWRDVLGVTEIGSSDNFFDLGGHSLLAVRVHQRLKEAFPERRLAITDLFRFPTIVALTEHLAPQPIAESQPVANDRATQQRGQQRAEMRRAMLRRVLPRRGSNADE